MKLFSQRKGLKPVKNIIQIDSIDTELKNGLWDALTFFYWNRMENADFLSQRADIHVLFKVLWHDFYKRPIDTLDPEIVE